jgi:hypothetical protein
MHRAAMTPASLQFRWGIAGSRTAHCMDCCPPPPMSPEQTKQVAGILADILVNATDRSNLDVWRLTLSPDPVRSGSGLSSSRC